MTDPLEDGLVRPLHPVAYSFTDPDDGDAFVGGKGGVDDPDETKGESKRTDPPKRRRDAAAAAAAATGEKKTRVADVDVVNQFEWTRWTDLDTIIANTDTDLPNWLSPWQWYALREGLEARDVKALEGAVMPDHIYSDYSVHHPATATIRALGVLDLKSALDPPETDVAVMVIQLVIRWMAQDTKEGIIRREETASAAAAAEGIGFAFASPKEAAAARKQDFDDAARITPFMVMWRRIVRTGLRLNPERIEMTRLAVTAPSETSALADTRLTGEFQRMFNPTALLLAERSIQIALSAINAAFETLGATRGVLAAKEHVNNLQEEEELRLQRAAGLGPEVFSDTALVARLAEEAAKKAAAAAGPVTHTDPTFASIERDDITVQRLLTWLQAAETTLGMIRALVQGVQDAADAGTDYKASMLVTQMFDIATTMKRNAEDYKRAIPLIKAAWPSDAVVPTETSVAILSTNKGLMTACSASDIIGAVANVSDSLATIGEAARAYNNVAAVADVERKEALALGAANKAFHLMATATSFAVANVLGFTAVYDLSRQFALPRLQEPPAAAAAAAVQPVAPAVAAVAVAPEPVRLASPPPAPPPPVAVAAAAVSAAIEEPVVVVSSAALQPPESKFKVTVIEKSEIDVELDEVIDAQRKRVYPSDMDTDNVDLMGITRVFTVASADADARPFGAADAFTFGTSIMFVPQLLQLRLVESDAMGREVVTLLVDSLVKTCFDEKIGLLEIGVFPEAYSPKEGDPSAWRFVGFSSRIPVLTHVFEQLRADNRRSDDIRKALAHAQNIINGALPDLGEPESTEGPWPSAAAAAPPPPPRKPYFVRVTGIIPPNLIRDRNRMIRHAVHEGLGLLGLGESGTEEDKGERKMLLEAKRDAERRDKERTEAAARLVQEEADAKMAAEMHEREVKRKKVADAAAAAAAAPGPPPLVVADEEEGEGDADYEEKGGSEVPPPTRSSRSSGPAPPPDPTVGATTDSEAEDTDTDEEKEEGGGGEEKKEEEEEEGGEGDAEKPKAKRTPAKKKKEWPVVPPIPEKTLQDIANRCSIKTLEAWVSEAAGAETKQMRVAMFFAHFTKLPNGLALTPDENGLMYHEDAELTRFSNLAQGLWGNPALRKYFVGFVVVDSTRAEDDLKEPWIAIAATSIALIADKMALIAHSQINFSYETIDGLDGWMSAIRARLRYESVYFRKKLGTFIDDTLCASSGATYILRPITRDRRGLYWPEKTAAIKEDMEWLNALCYHELEREAAHIMKSGPPPNKNLATVRAEIDKIIAIGSMTKSARDAKTKAEFKAGTKPYPKMYLYRVTADHGKDVCSNRPLTTEERKAATEKKKRQKERESVAKKLEKIEKKKAKEAEKERKQKAKEAKPKKTKKKKPAAAAEGGEEKEEKTKKKKEKQKKKVGVPYVHPAAAAATARVEAAAAAAAAAAASPDTSSDAELARLAGMEERAKKEERDRKRAESSAAAVAASVAVASGPQPVDESLDESASGVEGRPRYVAGSSYDTAAVIADLSNERVTNYFATMTLKQLMDHVVRVRPGMTPYEPSEEEEDVAISGKAKATVAEVEERW